MVGFKGEEEIKIGANQRRCHRQPTKEEEQGPELGRRGRETGRVNQRGAEETWVGRSRKRQGCLRGERRRR